MSQKFRRFTKSMKRVVQAQERAINDLEASSYGDGERCRAIKTDGAQCEIAAMKGGYYCKHHQPKKESR
jgi:hypothetical protein